MSFEAAFFGLLACMMIREAYFLIQIQKLLNKAMSRSYHEYQLAQTLKKPRELVRVEEDLPEDLGALQGIG